MNNKIFHNLSAAVAAGLALPYSKILKTREFSTQNKMNRLFAGKKRAVAELFILQQLLLFRLGRCRTERSHGTLLRSRSGCRNNRKSDENRQFPFEELAVYSLSKDLAKARFCSACIFTCTERRGSDPASDDWRDPGCLPDTQS